MGRGGPASGKQQVPLQPQRQEQQQQQHPGQGAVSVGPLSPSHVWQCAGLQVSFGLISPKEKWIAKMSLTTCRHMEIHVLSFTDVSSSTSTHHLLFSLAMTIPSPFYPKTQNLQRSLVCLLNTLDLLHLLTKLWARAWTTTQQHSLVRCGSMEDSRAACQQWPQICPAWGTQTLPKNYLYGLYQCKDMENIIQELVYWPNI